MIVLCSENKDSEQLRDYLVADLRVCMLQMQKAGFLMTLSIFSSPEPKAHKVSL